MKSSAKIATGILNDYAMGVARGWVYPAPYVNGSYLIYKGCWITKSTARRIFGCRAKYFHSVHASSSPFLETLLLEKDPEFFADGMIALEHLPPDFPEVFNALKELHPTLQS